MCAMTVTKEKGRRHSLGMASIDLDLGAPAGTPKQTAMCAGRRLSASPAAVATRQQRL